MAASGSHAQRLGERPATASPGGAIGNDTDYGLYGYVAGADLEQARAIVTAAPDDEGAVSEALMRLVHGRMVAYREQSRAQTARVTEALRAGVAGTRQQRGARRPLDQGSGRHRRCRPRRST